MAEENDSVEFLPGFTNFRGTKPGAVLQNPVFHLTFSEVLLNGKKSAVVSRGFEGCYDWTDVMNILLESLRNFKDIKTSEKLAMKYLKSWFLTYAGWGLFSTLLPRQQHIDFKQAMRSLKENWQLNQEYTETKCWRLFCQDKDMEAIIPKFKVTIGEGNFGLWAGRQKWITLKFVTPKWNMEIRFIAGKQKMEKGNLVAIASAAVAAHLEDFDDVDHLEIPRTLMKPVAEIMEDHKWIKSAFPSGHFLKALQMFTPLCDA